MHKDRSVADLHASKNNGSGDNQCFSLFIRGVLGGSSRKPGFVGIAAEHGNAPEVDIPSFGYANFDAAEDASDFQGDFVTIDIGVAEVELHASKNRCDSSTLKGLAPDAPFGAREDSDGFEEVGGVVHSADPLQNDGRL